MVRVSNIVNAIVAHINDNRYKLEILFKEEGISFKASFYHDYFYVDKETRIYDNTEITLLETFIGAMLDDIASITFYVFDCHALKDNITKEFLNELEDKICNGNR